MFERFTDRAREVLVLAQDEARTINHQYIGTEHILLGLLREEEGLAARVLESLDITLERAREQVVRIVGSGKDVASGQIPFTPRAKKVLELALREAMSLDHDYIGTEHILLGLARENEGVAARVLLDFDADADKVRGKVLGMLSGPGSRRRGALAAIAGGERGRFINTGWLDGLGPLLVTLAPEIRQDLGREPDEGDLLLALACTPHTLAARALHELGLDLDALWGTVERLRQQRSGAQDELARRIQETVRAKEQAIESQEFQSAAALRDEERELLQQARAHKGEHPGVLEEIRHRLGIPGPSEELREPPASD